MDPRPRNHRRVPYITTLLEVGRMLHVPIPRALVRELGLVKRQRVYVWRIEGRKIVAEPLEDYLRERQRVPGRRP
jgi:hypothetical protein